jgi:hypothetical protein
VSEDTGIEPKTAATLESVASTTRLHLIHFSIHISGVAVCKPEQLTLILKITAYVSFILLGYNCNAIVKLQRIKCFKMNMGGGGGRSEVSVTLIFATDMLGHKNCLVRLPIQMI